MLLFFPLFSTILYDRYIPIQTLMIALLPVVRYLLFGVTLQSEIFSTLTEKISGKGHFIDDS